MRIAITGHRGLPPETERLITEAVRKELRPYAGDGLAGLTCLADGADQIFARAVLDMGGSLEVLIPAPKYREGLPEASHATYDALLTSAAK
ncbi:MAG: hypothetical protein ACRDN9_14140 [Streptosporangiaceae bacterium]